MRYNPLLTSEPLISRMKDSKPRRRATEWREDLITNDFGRSSKKVECHKRLWRKKWEYHVGRSRVGRKAERQSPNCLIGSLEFLALNRRIYSVKSEGHLFLGGV